MIAHEVDEENMESIPQNLSKIDIKIPSEQI